MFKTYSELIALPTFEERFRYLQDSAHGFTGQETFGCKRYLNQTFYQRSPEWKRARREVIIRDGACDLGIQDRPIYERLFVHHMNPVTEEDIINGTQFLLDPEYLICVGFTTHNALHYGDESILEPKFIERSVNDMCPWK